MFKLLRRKFYSVLIVIFVIILIIMLSAYFVIEKTLVNDYTSKTSDIARKTANDFRIKTDYAEHISLRFVNQLIDKTADTGVINNEEFNGNINRIRIYDSDVKGLGIFWDSNEYFISAAEYLGIASELRDAMENTEKKKWFITEENGGYIFLLLPVKNKFNSRKGFAAVDVSLLKTIYKSDNLFMKDAVVYMQTDDDRFYLSGSADEEYTGGITIKEYIQSDFKLVMQFPMTEVTDRLFHVKLYMILFGVFCMSMAAVAVHKSAKKISNELEILKDEIDMYAKEGSIKSIDGR